MREKITDHVVLRCCKCRAENAEWELTNFMRQLGKEYRKECFVLQYCGCIDSNTEHVIVGLSTVHDKPRTAKQVFSLWEQQVLSLRERRKKAKR